jgi:hypothetical protein
MLELGKTMRRQYAGTGCRVAKQPTKGEGESASSKGVCFVVAPIGGEGSDTRRRSDQVFRHIIAPVVGALGYEAVRADQISQPGVITTQIVQQLLDAPLVVADLKDHNPNLFYELAIRHATGKPVVQIIDHAQSLPFDVAANRTIKFSHQDLDSFMYCKHELRRQVEAVETDPTSVDSPVTQAMTRSLLKMSDVPSEKFAAQILERLEEIQLAVNNQDGEIRDLRSVIDRRGRLSLRFNPGRTVIGPVRAGWPRRVHSGNLQGHDFWQPARP